jgi:hypothetical protein
LDEIHFRVWLPEEGTQNGLASLWLRRNRALGSRATSGVDSGRRALARLTVFIIRAMSRSLRLSFGLSCLAMFTFTGTSVAQETRTVSGTVSDSSGRPIPYVNIDGGPKYRTLANASGEFTLSVPPKEGVDVLIRRIGYQPAKIRIEPGSDTTINVSMQQLAVLLTTQMVRAQQLVRTLETRGFYSRMLDQTRGALVGEFITPEEIEMRNAQRVTQLMDQRRGITVRRTGSCQVIATCYRVYGQGGCAATVYLDGQRLNRLATAAADPSSAPAIDELIPVTGVSGIEVYPRGSSAPPKYQSLAGTCAVIVIWTK